MKRSATNSIPSPATGHPGPETTVAARCLFASRMAAPSVMAGRASLASSSPTFRICSSPRLSDNSRVRSRRPAPVRLTNHDRWFFAVAQSSVAKYMVKRPGPPSQGWRTFLRNHAQDIAAMDLFVVPTIGFDLLYAYIIVRLDRRELVWISVTTHPTAELGCAPDHRSIPVE